MSTYSPVIREIALPSSALAAFSTIRARPGAILLESATREPKLARWSFLASDPFLTFRSKGPRIELHRAAGVEAREGDPFAALGELLADLRVERPPDAPPLIAGALGYFGYDLGRFVERIPEDTADDLPVADCHLGFYGAVLTIDHIAGRAWVSAIGAPEEDPAAARKLAQARAVELEERLLKSPNDSAPPARPPLIPRLPITSNFTKESYLAAVRRSKDYIAAGDIYEVNLSQRLSAPLATTPFDLYRRLTDGNPAPFAAYFETPDAAVVSCSPERFLQVRGREVETRPMKGTRPRGATPEEDARLARELVDSIKDRAENVMIVDLERNDIGRVCEFGSVHVPELFVLESYATVHQLVSTVRGRLRPDATSLDCLRACFPGGSITGAPKVRSMEIIEELEPTRRGIYTGAIGYLCFSGDMDVNIVIRTAVIQSGIAHFQVGGAIVADSDPEAEYQETVDKGIALARALAAEAQTEEIRWPE
jgi:para-aminobenzoate synthetase component 1